MSGDRPTATTQAPPAADSGGLDEFARQFRPALTRYFGKRASQQSDIDDLVQEVFTRLAVRGGEDAIRQPEAYLLRTAGNVWRDFLRKQKTHVQAEHDPYREDQHAPPDSGPEQALQGTQAIEALLAALNQLPERTRQVFVLCRVEGMRQGAVARRLGVSVSSVEKHMMKAIAHLAVRLGDSP